MVENSEVVVKLQCLNICDRSGCVTWHNMAMALPSPQLMVSSGRPVTWDRCDISSKWEGVWPVTCRIDLNGTVLRLTIYTHLPHSSSTGTKLFAAISFNLVWGMSTVSAEFTVRCFSEVRNTGTVSQLENVNLNHDVETDIELQHKIKLSMIISKKVWQSIIQPFERPSTGSKGVSISELFACSLRPEG